MSVRIISPQPIQEVYLSCEADILICAGSAGVGKTFFLNLDPLHYFKEYGFDSVCFRRIRREIFQPRSNWDQAMELFPLLGGIPKKGAMRFEFPEYGSRIGFGSLAKEDDAIDTWGSAEICELLFDQLETFTERQFFFMLSRLRSIGGVPTSVRGSANPPIAPHWLPKFIDWWIAEDGYADMERAGKLRWFVRPADELVWADHREDLIEKYPKILPMSVTFIPGSVYDNEILLKQDPAYLSRLMALPLIDRMRLLGDKKRGGNWKVVPGAGKIFNRKWPGHCSGVPRSGVEVLYWDLAATEKKMKKKNKETGKNEPSFTSAIAIRYTNGIYYIRRFFNKQLAPKDVDEAFLDLSRACAEECKDSGTRYKVRWEIEPGSAGIRESRRLSAALPDLDAKGIRKTGDKISEWKPLSAAMESGNVKILDSWWTDECLTQLHNAPDSPFDDVPDACAGAYNCLVDEGDGLGGIHV